ncbi:MAG: protoporphyrinogen oxidase, partial [Actinomycetota bacterium]|nr:protoporphyrinogen oxidase [Actinomycetota bacterium]
ARIEDDTTVGSFARKRWGKEVTDLLIEPLVGGIHAGTTYQLSLAQCAPQYLKAAQHFRSVSVGLKSQTANYTPNGHPAFYSFSGGLSDLVESLAELLRNRAVQILTNCESVEIIQLPDGYRVVTKDRTLDVEGVICATPSYVSAKLLRPVSRHAAELLGSIEYASPIMTLLSYEDNAFPEPLQGSGVLVPRPNGTLATAVTFATNKWPQWKSDGETILRVSAGRIGDNRAWEFSDEALVANLEAEIKRITGVKSRSARHDVSRWHNRIPQFKPFHSQLTRRVRESLPAGIELAGAPFLGIGIPACISSGATAAERLSKALAKPH